MNEWLRRCLHLSVKGEVTAVIQMIPIKTLIEHSRFKRWWSLSLSHKECTHRSLAAGQGRGGEARRGGECVCVYVCEWERVCACASDQPGENNKRPNGATDVNSGWAPAACCFLAGGQFHPSTLIILETNTQKKRIRYWFLWKWLFRYHKELFEKKTSTNLVCTIAVHPLGKCWQRAKCWIKNRTSIGAHD